MTNINDITQMLTVLAITQDGIETKLTTEWLEEGCWIEEGCHVFGHVTKKKSVPFRFDSIVEAQNFADELGATFRNI